MPRVSAIVVTQRRRGPGQLLGMGDAYSEVSASQSILNTITGGDYATQVGKLDSLETGLIVSTIASGLAAALALSVLFGRRG